MLANNDIPCARLVLSRSLDRKASPTMMLQQLHKAIAGEYTPRPDITEKALDDAECALILGGPRSLHALQSSQVVVTRHLCAASPPCTAVAATLTTRTASPPAQGFLSKSTIMQNRERPRFITSWDSTVQPATVRTNMRRFILDKPPPAATPRSIHHIMIDDVAIEKRHRPSPEDNL